jgi:chromosome segregation ATPase
MPVESSTFWSRFAALFKKTPANNGEKSELPAIGDDGLLAEPAEYPDPAGADAEAGSERTVNPLMRWSRREQTLVRLQEGYERLSQVIEEIQKHLAQQGERSDRICNALETLARSLGDMPGLARQHAQSLEAIAGNIEAGNARMGQLAESVGELPKVSRAQTDAITGIKRQLEVAGEQNLVTFQTMEKLSSAISTLGEVNTTQLEALHQMNRKSDDQTDQLRKLIARQNKRFVMLFVVTIILALGAIAAGIVGLALR